MKLKEFQKKHIKNYDDAFIDTLTRRNKQLENNWNELKKHLTDYINVLENQKDNVEGLDIFEEHALDILKEIVDKTQEIESRKK